MGRTTKPRKRYRPMPIDATAVDTAIDLATKLRPHQQAELTTPMRTALDRARMGVGGWPAWCALADALNVAEQLAGRGIASDRMPEILAAQEALHTLHQRQAARGTWTLHAAELRALTEGVAFHAIQLQFCSQGELRDSIAAVRRNVSQALAGNASPTALVCIGALGHDTTNHPTP